MDNVIVGSLNSLADYGLGESDIEDFEDSDNDLQSEDNSVKPVQLIPAKSSISATQTRVKTSARLVSYDDVAEEDEGDAEKEKGSESMEDIHKEKMDEDKASSKEECVEVQDTIAVKPTDQIEAEMITDTTEQPAAEEKSSEAVGDFAEVLTNTIPAIRLPQLPPEPTGRCSNKLQEKILKLLEKKHRENLDLNTSIQKRKDFRNPSIYKKLLSYLNLDETGSNYPKSLFDPSSFTEDSYYENLSKAQKEAYEKKEKEKAKQARTHVEFVSGTKKPVHGGEEPKKRKSKWDVSVVPAPAVKTATPPTKVGVQGSGVASASDSVTAAKKPKILA